MGHGDDSSFGGLRTTFRRSQSPPRHRSKPEWDVGTDMRKYANRAKLMADVYSKRTLAYMVLYYEHAIKHEFDRVFDVQKQYQLDEVRPRARSLPPYSTARLRVQFYCSSAVRPLDCSACSI
eukprot:COSAG05_NODE_2415_length_3092_cov_13.057802_4_plen_122_part_00